MKTSPGEGAKFRHNFITTTNIEFICLKNGNIDQRLKILSLCLSIPSSPKWGY
jgi:hypothetical protein